ncbi:MAG: hypothetical protein JXB88_20155 [Spirochaetales bacterium]|nr:hypothetical protein [Spirochaetales bacterium]
MKNIKMVKDIFIIHLCGFFFIVIVGSLLHFTYQWSGYSPVVGMFCAVNESVWEHLKLGFWSLILYSFIDYWLLKNKTQNYFFAKAAGVLSMQFFIVAFFYLYTAFVSGSILFVDISLYISGALLCQLLSYIIITAKKYNNVLNITGIAMAVLFAFCLCFFTFFPPKLPPFRDSVTGNYGIE